MDPKLADSLAGLIDTIKIPLIAAAMMFLFYSCD